MKKTYKISNSLLVYSTGFLSILIYIFAIFATVKVVNEASQVGFAASVSENLIATIVGAGCLFLAVPAHKLTKKLRILELSVYENGPAILSIYTPLLADDMPQADSKISIKNLKEIRNSVYFNRLVELHFGKNGNEKIIKSFIGPNEIEIIENAYRP